MLGNGRYSVTRRLLAATLSLVLVLASLIGAHAHAGHHGHHHDHGVHGVLDDRSGVDHDADSAHGPGGTGSIAGQAVCGDLLCHGGFAILLEHFNRVHLHQHLIVLIPSDDARAGSERSSLDRPPRLSVLV